MLPSLVGNPQLANLRSQQISNYQGLAKASKHGRLVAAGWELRLNQLPYIVRTDSTGNVNNCNSVRAATAVAASVSTTSVGLSIRHPLNR
ncbi:MAG: hypothetical protein ACHQ1H_03235 [Nitrososphaerales archaeon]